MSSHSAAQEEAVPKSRPQNRQPNGSVFAADAEGFREQNAGRPAAHLVRELVQNAFDEAATCLRVEVTWSAEAGARVRVEDDVPGGIRDISLLFTIWKSDKQDSPTKRGRMGRGLKELISVADRTLIRTERAQATEFVRHRGGRWERSHPRKLRPERGTVVECEVPAWRKRDVEEVVAYLRRMRPPQGLAFQVNGEAVLRKPALETYRLKLPTVLFEETPAGRAARERSRECEVELFEEAESWVYELGVPVEPVDFPCSIDVGQRVPLRERRDTITESYRRELFAKLLGARLPRLEPAQLRDGFALVAAQGRDHLSNEAKRALAEVWTGGKAYATSPEVFSHATGAHIPAVTLRSLPEPLRAVVREVGTDVAQVLAERQAVSCVELRGEQLSAEEHQLVAGWAWVAQGVGRPCRVAVCSGRPSASASFDRPTRTLSLYREVLGEGIFRRPFGPEALRLLIHELAHWESHGHEHGFDFHSDAERVGGAVAAFLLEHAQEALQRTGKGGTP